MDRKKFRISKEGEGERLDRWLAERLPQLSRNRIQRLIQQGFITLDGRPAKPSTRLIAGTLVEVTIPPAKMPKLEPEAMELSILYEDEDLVVVDKPSGVVVYPGAGHPRGTLIQGLLGDRQLARVGSPERPGVVHRLDKETSGVMVFAKSDAAYYHLIRQFKNHEIQKTYLALVHGRVRGARGRIEAAIGRALRHRQRMEIKARGGRSAITEFRVLKRLDEGTLLIVRPHTGRTHQIRVHLTAIGHPIMGDLLYGRKNRSTPSERLMLHAWKLRLTHPKGGQMLEVTAPPPPEFQPYLSGILALEEDE